MITVSSPKKEVLSPKGTLFVFEAKEFVPYVGTEWFPDNYILFPTAGDYRHPCLNPSEYTVHEGPCGCRLRGTNQHRPGIQSHKRNLVKVPFGSACLFMEEVITFHPSSSYGAEWYNSTIVFYCEGTRLETNLYFWNACFVKV